MKASVLMGWALAAICAAPAGAAERLPDGVLLPGDVHAATSVSH